MRILAILFLFSSCSVFKGESFVSSTGMPKIKLKEHQRFLAKRSIASVDIDGKMYNKSNKDLYFFSLYFQFNKFNSFLKEDKLALNHCPQFHNDLIKYQGMPNTNYSVSPTHSLNDGQINEELYYYYPELNLPVDESEVLGSSTSGQYSDNFNTAVYKHTEKTLNELRELCDHGSSDNYYVYENFVRHIGKQPNFYQYKDSFQALIKIPVIANIIILQSMIDIPGYDLIGFEKEALSRVRGRWVLSYMAEIKNKRKEILTKSIPNQNESYQNAWNFYSRSFGR